MKDDYCSKQKYRKVSDCIKNSRIAQSRGHNLVFKNGAYLSEPTELMLSTWSARPDLQKHFPDIYSADLSRYWDWWIARSRIEGIVQAVLPEELMSERIAEENLSSVLKDLFWENSEFLQSKFPRPLDEDMAVFCRWWNTKGIDKYRDMPDQTPGKMFDLIKFSDDEAVQYITTLKIEKHNDPQVSLIIPVFNAFRHAVECVASILDHVRASYEIIVLDDASTDPRVEQYFSRIQNLVYRRNAVNKGYLLSVNRAVQESQGRYLVLVNSDLQFVNDAISLLIKALEVDPRAVVAGPKVLYPTGVLQEAGCSISQYCVSSMIGLNGESADGRYSFDRYVDYVSGVCFAITREAFIQHGGFDEALAPAYTEDLDLCARVIRGGGKVLYVSGASVVHHLSVSSRQLSSSYKYRQSAINRGKIYRNHAQFFKQYGKVKAIAFYLPQFHEIEENNYWWGKGYTEWTATARAKPNYADHYQPHVPADLGFYDLCNEKVFHKQAALAKRYGIHGFCFYYYNFGHREILQKPLDAFLASGADLPFCLCWANENWTRTWDGLFENVLLKQGAVTDTEFMSIIEGMERFLVDDRYITVDGRPLILIYREKLIDNIKEKLMLWREYWRERHRQELYVCVVDSLDRVMGCSDSPDQIGFDAAVEFPVHGIRTTISIMDHPEAKDSEFRGTLIDYTDAVCEILNREHPRYKRFPSVFPSWDNTPRRGFNSTIFANSHPSVFQRYLEDKIKDARIYTGDERMLFINAWNEWGEGAHLEPDLKYGHTWLEMISAVLKKD